MLAQHSNKSSSPCALPPPPPPPSPPTYLPTHLLHKTLQASTMKMYGAMQVHSATKHVEYRGEIMELSESLLELPAGGQVILSDTTFQHIGGRLHEVKLPSLEVPKPDSYSLDGQPRGKGNRQRDSLDGMSRQKLDGQVRPEGQRSEQSSAANSRRSSMDTIAKLVHCSCSSVTNHTQISIQYIRALHLSWQLYCAQEFDERRVQLS